MAVKRECDVIEMTLPARAEYVGVARLAVSGVANRLGFSYDEIEDIKLAVAEACTNAVRHAYADAEGSVRIQCRVYQDRLEILVSDEGASFDVDGARARMKPLDSDADVTELAEGGLGLYLIHALMDEVRIFGDSGVVVAMTKYRRRDEVEGDDEGCPEPRLP